MSEPLPPHNKFFPLSVGTYIRIEAIAACLKAEAAGEEYAPRTTKFKIAKDYYTQLINYEPSSPLLGLILDYDEASSELSVTPDNYVMDLYTNKIMREVALKQSDDFQIRYSKFIEKIS